MKLDPKKNAVAEMPAEGQAPVCPEQVLGVKFCDGGYFEGTDHIEAIRTREGIMLVVLPSWRMRRSPVCRAMSEQEWRHLLNKLLDELHICSWKREYCDWQILDGEQWNLELRLTDDRVLKITGSNDYPIEWDKLLSLFDPFLRECAVSEDTDEASYLKHKAAYEELIALRNESASNE